jgi:hypothetical protein
VSTTNRTWTLCSVEVGHVVDSGLVRAVAELVDTTVGAVEAVDDAAVPVVGVAASREAVCADFYPPRDRVRVQRYENTSRAERVNAFETRVMRILCMEFA